MVSYRQMAVTIFPSLWWELKRRLRHRGSGKIRGIILMFRQFLPKEVSFFEYFERHSDMEIHACKTFLELMKTGVGLAEKSAQIKEIEHQADDLTHKCVEELNRTFITPIDRTDIHLLIKRLDDIVDSVDAATSRLALYELIEMREEAVQLAEVLLKAVEEIAAALKGLRNLKNLNAIMERLIVVHQLENEGDAILRAALTRLFKEDDQPVLIIKWKEIFERLEKATDRCEEVANLIEKIVIEAS